MKTIGKQGGNVEFALTAKTVNNNFLLKCNYTFLCNRGNWK